MKIHIYNSVGIIQKESDRITLYFESRIAKCTMRVEQGFDLDEFTTDCNANTIAKYINMVFESQINTSYILIPYRSETHVIVMSDQYMNSERFELDFVDSFWKSIRKAIRFNGIFST